MTLAETCRDFGLSEIDAMNILQDAGVVSDNAVNLEDVHENDVPQAIKYLEEM